MHGRVWFVAFSVCLVLSGCGMVRGGRDDEDRAGRAAAPAGTSRTKASAMATPTPMPTPSPSPSPTPRPTPSPTPSPVAAAALRRALLAPDDLPGGWSAFGSAPLPSPCGQPPALEAAAHALVEQTFGDSALGPFVRHAVASYPAGEAAPALERTRQLFTECDEWDGTYLDRRFTFRVSPLSFPALGDQSFALRLAAEGPIFLSGESVLVFVRRDGVVVLLAHTAAGFGGASVDRDLTERLARRAEERVRAVADGR